MSRLTSEDSPYDPVLYAGLGLLTLGGVIFVIRGRVDLGIAVLIAAAAITTAAAVMHDKNQDHRRKWR